MGAPPPRIARVVLVDGAGAVRGALPPVPVATPWWQDVAPVVDAVRARDGAEVTVLRLLQVGEPTQAGLEVTYLAEGAPSAPTEPWVGLLDEHPLRLAYARPGGPSADLAWAEGVLARRGLTRVGPAVQVRTWNLSSLWRLPLTGQTAWLKVVPPFFAHEGGVLEALADGPVPQLLGHEGPRLLMAELPGVDGYGAAGPVLARMAELLVEVQAGWLGRADPLLALGLPDWRGPSLSQAIAAVVERTAPQLDPADRALLASFVGQLPARFAAIAACGLPDTLVHGDYHPGNLRIDGDALFILDWGDSGVGCPLLDEAAFLGRTGADEAEVKRRWHAAWARVVPGADPDRASTLIAPIAAARQAVIYQRFLDGIEPSEHVYHARDPVDWLTRTAALVRANG